MRSRRRKPPRRRPTVQHAVKARLRQRFVLTLEGSALDFVIQSDGRKLGTLGIGKGSITWRGRKDKRALPLVWTQFVALMERERQERKSRRG